MTDDDSFELSRRKVLGSLGAMGVAGAAAGFGTSAYFSDEEVFVNNSLMAGELDVKAAYSAHYSDWSADEGDGVDVRMWDGAPDTTGTADDLMDGETGLPANDAWLIAVDDPDQFLANTQYAEAGTASCDGGTDADALPQPVIEISDVKPGDFGEVTFDFTICDNPGFVWMTGELIDASEDGYTEPERKDPDESGDANDDGDDDVVELLDVVQAAAWVDDGGDGPGGNEDGNNYQNDGETPAIVGSLREVLDSLSSGSGLSLNGDIAPEEGGGMGDVDCFSAVTPHSVAFAWWVPIDHGNEIQTDSATFDLGFYTEQCRHNEVTTDEEELSCECPETSVDTATAQSPEVTVQSTDVSAFPQVSTFLTVDTTAGTNGDLTADDFALAEDGCGQDISVAFTSEDKPVDFVFLLDVTGSMGGELDGVKAEMQDFVNSVEGEGIDARYALYLYGDDEETGPPAVYLKKDFTSDGDEFNDAVQDTSLEEEVGYGGDGPEDNYEAILTADNDLSYRAGSQRVMIDITDAPGEEDPSQEIGGLAQTRDNAVMVINDNNYTYIAVSPDDDSEHQKKPLAQTEADNGLWVELGTNFEPILGAVEEEVATSYRVRYTTACPQEDGSTRDVVIEIEDPGEGTLYGTTSYTAPGS